MPSNFSLSIDGLDRVIQAFNDLQTGVPKRIVARFDTAAKRVYAASQRSVPVDTGELKASAYQTTVPGGQQPYAEVTYGTDHCWYVELGTSRMAAQPYLGPPFEEESQKLVTSIGDILGG